MGRADTCMTLSTLDSLPSSDDFCQASADLTVRSQRLESTVSGGDDLIGIGGPAEWLCLGRVMLVDEAVDRGLQVDEGDPPPMTDMSSSMLSTLPSNREYPKRPIVAKRITPGNILNWRKNLDMQDARLYLERIRVTCLPRGKYELLRFRDHLEPRRAA